MTVPTGRVVGLPQRAQVVAMARDLFAGGPGGEEISRTIARRTGLREREVDWILAGEMVARDTEAASLRTAIVGGIHAARLAGLAVWSEHERKTLKGGN